MNTEFAAICFNDLGQPVSAEASQSCFTVKKPTAEKVVYPLEWRTEDAYSLMANEATDHLLRYGSGAGGFTAYDVNAEIKAAAEAAEIGEQILQVGCFIVLAPLAFAMLLTGAELLSVMMMQGADGESSAFEQGMRRASGLPPPIV